MSTTFSVSRNRCAVQNLITINQMPQFAISGSVCEVNESPKHCVIDEKSYDAVGGIVSDWERCSDNPLDGRVKVDYLVRFESCV